MPVYIGVDQDWQVNQQRLEDAAFADLLDSISRRRARREATYGNLAEMVARDPTLATDDVLARLGTSGMPGMDELARSLRLRRQALEESSKSVTNFEQQLAKAQRSQVEVVPNNDPSVIVPDTASIRSSLASRTSPEGTPFFLDKNAPGFEATPGYNIRVNPNFANQFAAGSNPEEWQRVAEGLRASGLSQKEILDMISQPWDKTTMDRLPDPVQAFWAGGNQPAAQEAMKWASGVELSPTQQREFEAERENERQQRELTRRGQDLADADRDATRATKGAGGARAPKGGATYKDELKSAKEEMADLVQPKTVKQEKTITNPETGKVTKMGEMEERPVEPGKETLMPQGTANAIARNIADVRWSFRTGTSKLDDESKKRVEKSLSGRAAKEYFNRAIKKYGSAREAADAVSNIYSLLNRMNNDPDDKEIQGEFLREIRTLGGG